MKPLQSFRMQEQEQLRARDLIRLLPRGQRTVLDVGARDGYFSQLLTEYFEEVTALELKKPDLDIERVIPVSGDIRKLDFSDQSFDCVFCAEVLEHIPELEQAAFEISRVARSYLLIGVPFKQDIRVGRTTCSSCGQINPPWGHINTFTQEKLINLFKGWTPIEVSFVGLTKSKTNPISAWLMNIAGNPWGRYNQEESCIKCGAKIFAPTKRTSIQRICSFSADQLNLIQGCFVQPWPDKMHILFKRI